MAWLCIFIFCIKNVILIIYVLLLGCGKRYEKIKYNLPLTAASGGLCYSTEKSRHPGNWLQSLRGQKRCKATKKRRTMVKTNPKSKQFQEVDYFDLSLNAYLLGKKGLEELIGVGYSLLSVPELVINTSRVGMVFRKFSKGYDLLTRTFFLVSLKSVRTPLRTKLCIPCAP